MPAQFDIDVAAVDFERTGLGCQVIDAAQERDLRLDIDRLAARAAYQASICACRASRFAEPLLVSRRKSAEEGGQALPERSRAHAGPWQGFALDEVQQGLRDAEAGALFVSHRRVLQECLSPHSRSDRLPRHRNVAASSLRRGRPGSSLKTPHEACDTRGNHLR